MPGNDKSTLPEIGSLNREDWMALWADPSHLFRTQFSKDEWLEHYDATHGFTPKTGGGDGSGT